MTVSKFVAKARPTNWDLQEQVGEVHDCLHNVASDVEHQGLQMAALAGALGVQLPTRQELAEGTELKRVGRKLAGLSWWQAMAGIGAIIPAGMAAYKVLEPAIVAFASALHHALMH